MGMHGSASALQVRDLEKRMRFPKIPNLHREPDVHDLRFGNCHRDFHLVFHHPRATVD